MSGPEQSLACRVYALRAVGNQEYNVAFMLKSRAEHKGLDKVKISAIVVLPSLKGFVFVEGTMPYEIQDLATNIKHYRGMVRGVMNADELLGSLVKPVEISIGDVVEIIVEPFRGYRGKVVDIDKQRGQVYLELLDSSSTMPIIVNIKGVRKVEGK
ncbi:transcription elongation factor Spt5 [Vulcanisaeta souniana]|uniref:Transcription elongation factor Spt5 n=1 Tax=Vulcanisaeta souniana JCM 11219 TaxID=1293586 RepID=A0A830EG31_9CREN|nr:transcription elongation factor Spt5 [Vulcanisaeta souniana]BDR90930.1 transcription elongation factor Spt5 [Vulcanisaeta souniana JCM 11219]GGI79408.1 transcription elongation factor Spt5 [Vulcanisaeta souniana JCM 11219]